MEKSRPKVARKGIFLKLEDIKEASNSQEAEVRLNSGKSWIMPVKEIFCRNGEKGIEYYAKIVLSSIPRGYGEVGISIGGMAEDSPLEVTVPQNNLAVLDYDSIRKVGNARENSLKSLENVVKGSVPSYVAYLEARCVARYQQTGKVKVEFGEGCSKRCMMSIKDAFFKAGSEGLVKVILDSQLPDNPQKNVEVTMMTASGFRVKHLVPRRYLHRNKPVYYRSA